MRQHNVDIFTLPEFRKRGSSLVEWTSGYSDSELTEQMSDRWSRDRFKMRREVKIRSQDHANLPRHRVRLNGEPLPTSFNSKNKLEAIIAPEAIPTASTYIVTLKCEPESFPKSHRAHLVVGLKP